MGKIWVNIQAMSNFASNKGVGLLIIQVGLETLKNSNQIRMQEK